MALKVFMIELYTASWKEWVFIMALNFTLKFKEALIFWLEAKEEALNW